MSTAYYGNGVVKVEMSHNHGKDPYGRGVWPYMVYMYDVEEDSYRVLCRGAGGQSFGAFIPKGLTLEMG